ncbi:MAG: phage/plasmid primase, P4 family [Candidatus Nitrosopolaris sp.]
MTSFTSDDYPDDDVPQEQQFVKRDLVLWLTSKIIEKHVFKTIRDTGEVYFYNNEKGVYRKGGERLIQERCQILYSQVKTHQVLEVVNQIIRRTGIDRCEFDSNCEIINLQNGLLNIHKLKLDKHSHKHLSFVQLPIKYKRDAKCPKITKFLNQVLKSKDIPTALQLIGYCLYKSAKFQKALMCVGKGSNGKSVFLELIGRFLGEHNVSHISLQDLCDDRFAKAGLFGKVANTFADLPLDLIKDSQAFKTLVSGDSIMAQEKYREKFYFHNYAKLFFSANRIPSANDDTYAYFRRWIIFSFENIFEGDDIDVNVIDKLTTERQMSGLLNLSLKALKRLIKDGEFINADNIDDVRKEYNRNSTTVYGFIADMCDVYDDMGKPYSTPTRVIYEHYITYCKEKGLDALASNAFGMEMADFHIPKERETRKGEREYCYIGIRLKEN